MYVNAPYIYIMWILWDINLSLSSRRLRVVYHHLPKTSPWHFNWWFEMLTLLKTNPHPPVSYAFATKLPGKPIYQVTIDPLVPNIYIYRELEDEGNVYPFPLFRSFWVHDRPGVPKPCMMGYVTVVFWRVLGGSPHLVIASLRGSQAIYKQTNPTWGLRNMVINHFLNSMTIYLGRFPNPSTTEPSTHWLNPARNRQAQ